MEMPLGPGTLADPDRRGIPFLLYSSLVTLQETLRWLKAAIIGRAEKGRGGRESATREQEMYKSTTARTCPLFSASEDDHIRHSDFCARFYELSVWQSCRPEGWPCKHRSIERNSCSLTRSALPALG